MKVTVHLNEAALNDFHSKRLYGAVQALRAGPTSNNVCKRSARLDAKVSTRVEVVDGRLCTRSHTKIRYTVSVVCTWMVQWEDNVMVVVDI